MPMKMSKCCSETNYLYRRALKGKGVIDRTLLTRRQHDELLAQPRQIPKEPPPPKRKVKQCSIPKICPPRVDQLAIPGEKLIKSVLQDFNKTLEAERVVRLVNLAHSNRNEKPRYSSQKCRRKKKKKKRKSKKENCLKVWLKKRVKKSAKLVMMWILQKQEFMPNYRQLLVSMGIFKSLRLKRKRRRCMCRYTKTYLMKICEQLAVYIDMDLTPYKKLPCLESSRASEVETVESKKHIYWQMREPSEEEEEEEEEEGEGKGEEEEEAAEAEESEAEGGAGEGEGIKAEEEEEEGKILAEIEEEQGIREGEDGIISGLEGEGGEDGLIGIPGEGIYEIGEGEGEGEGEDEGGMGSPPEVEGGAGTEQETEGEATTEAEESAVDETAGDEETQEESEQPEGETTAGEGKEEEGEEEEGGDRPPGGEESDALPIGYLEGEEDIEGEFDEIEGEYAGEEEGEFALEEGEEGMMSEDIHEGEETLAEGLATTEGEEMEGEEVEVISELQLTGAEETIVQEHPPDTLSYLTCQVYAAWLDEFASNITTYSKCLRRFREMLEARKLQTSDPISKILSNWGTYLKDSSAFESNMTSYLKGKPVTKCPKCGDYTLYNIPQDHDIPPEMKVAVDSTMRWKQILDEAEKLCEMYTTEPEDTMSMASHETVIFMDASMASSDTSMYVFEDFLPNNNNNNNNNSNNNNNNCNRNGRMYRKW